MRSTKMWTARFPIFMRARRPPCSCQQGDGRPRLPSHRQGRLPVRRGVRRGRVASKRPDAGYYSIAAASYGLQFGVQSFGYALFLTNNKATGLLNSQEGWQIGVGPSVVVMDQGMARSFTTATQLDDVYAFIFSQQGLMAGMGIQGSKITPYTPDD